MHVSYRMSVSATCPVDRSVRDDYTVTIAAEEMIKVEDLITLMAEYRTKVMYQEHLTQDIADRIAECISVTTLGMHSGVSIKCEATPS